MERGSPFTQTPIANPQQPAQLNPSSLGGVMTALQDLVRGQSALNALINAKFPDWVAPPTATSDPGQPGQVAYDSAYVYFCVAPSSWGRVALDFAF